MLKQLEIVLLLITAKIDVFVISCWNFVNDTAYWKRESEKQFLALRVQHASSANHRVADKTSQTITRELRSD